MTHLPAFDSDAAAVLTLAQAEAARRGHATVGTEHLLLALTDGSTSDACRILDTLGTSCAAVNAGIADFLPAGTPGEGGHPHLTPRARVALDIAMRSAARLGAGSTSPRHLLYGLAAEREGLAAKMLLRHGIDMAAVDRLLVPLPAG